MKFDVEFTVNRLTLKLQHRAVDLASKHQLEELLFPSGAAADTLPLPKLRSGGRTSAQDTHRYTLCRFFIICVTNRNVLFFFTMMIRTKEMCAFTVVHYV